MGVEELGVATVADDALAIAALVEETDRHARALGEGAEVVGVERRLVHHGESLRLERRLLRGQVAQVRQHKAGHVGDGRGERAGGRPAHVLEGARGKPVVCVAAREPLGEVVAQGLAER